MYELTLEKFVGPLDLLLNMVEEKKLSINEISLAEVADQYIAYLKALEEASKEELAYFLVIASTLMLIKSRSLIPSLKLTQEEEIDIKELENRLKMYKFFKEFSLKLGSLEKLNRHLFGREAYAGMIYFFSPPKNFDIQKLKKAIFDVLEVLPKTNDLPEDVMEHAVSLEEKITELKERMEHALFHVFSGKAKIKSEEKAELIVSFLAMLELIKQGFLVFEQKRLFDNIELKKYE
ncbi:MAG: segregation/condensation protein A [Patescibacteria group bacterium]